MLDKKKLGVRSPWQFPFNFEHFRELYYEKGNQTDMVTNGHSKKVVQGRVFNGTVHLFGTKGQKFLHCPGTKGQRDKLKSLPWNGTQDWTITIFFL